MKLATWLTGALVSVLVSLTGGQTTIQAALRAPADRESAPSFRLRDASGNAISLADFHDKLVVLNLWATECGGCKAELPTFVDLHRAYKDQGVAVIGVSMDVMYEDLKNSAEGWARVKPFAAAHDLHYLILMDDGSVEKAYKVTAMPATYLIDRRGRIAAAYVGIVDASDLKSNVQNLLTEGH